VPAAAAAVVIAGGMRITVNGEAVVVDVDRCDLDQLLLLRALPLEQVAVEQNGKVVRRADRKQTLVNDGDVFEIVTLVGGG
jgi:thiamine biosynthesis protein ThiS